MIHMQFQEYISCSGKNRETRFCLELEMYDVTNKGSKCGAAPLLLRGDFLWGNWDQRKEAKERQ